MKKVLWTFTCTVGMLLVVFGAALKMQENTAASIIGGADGPTSVYVVGKLNTNFPVVLMIIGIVVLAAAIIVCLRRKQ